MTGSVTSSFILVVFAPGIIRVLLFDPRHQETRKNQVGYLQDRTPRYIFIGRYPCYFLQSRPPSWWQGSMVQLVQSKQ